jgi:hypothetical protein
VISGCTAGFVYPEDVAVTIKVCRDGGNWKSILTGVTGNYSLQARVPTGTVPTGPPPGGNSTVANFCTQIAQMTFHNPGAGTHGTCGGWVAPLAAYRAHEEVHAARFEPAIENAAVTPVIETAIEALSVPDTGQGAAAAVAQIEGLPGYGAALANAKANWLAQILALVAGDHAAGGPTETAEHGVINTLVNSICNHFVTVGGAACPKLQL